ncbi:MAG TPA: GNAT family N-acetyltransferase [Ktedonobacteraceae bacterium]|nr:GNAT family N-acetyltransferase [Ktedonobacteraceae bacterium]
MSMDTNPSIWQGKQVRLRALEPGDWETYFAWNQDDEQSRTLYWIPFPQSQEAVKRFAERASVERSEDDCFRFVIENRAGEVVGDLSTNHCDRRVGSFGYGINTKKEHRQKGYASEAILLVLRYYFQELRYQKVTVPVYSFNEPSIKLHEKLGFQQEGRIRRIVFTRGQYYDELMYGMTVEEFMDKLAGTIEE